MWGNIVFLLFFILPLCTISKLTPYNKILPNIYNMLGSVSIVCDKTNAQRALVIWRLWWVTPFFVSFSCTLRVEGHPLVHIMTLHMTLANYPSIVKVSDTPGYGLGCHLQLTHL